ncbi:MAG: autotransporter-associated beta strand repeat-containing protein [Tepidisphaeraceae bacterium]
MAGIVRSAGAAEIVRGAAGALNVTTSWVGEVVPTIDDVAVWDAGSSGANTLGADLSFGGLKILSPGGGVTLSGANLLTLGALGIDMSAATQNLTLQPTPSTTTGIIIGASQTWNVGAGRVLQVANGSSAITGASGATITKSGAGRVYFNSATSTFAGGVILNAGELTFNTNTTTASGVISNGPLGTGLLTINGGVIAPNSTSGRDLANDVKVNADFTIGITGNGRVRSAGTWDLGSATRNIKLNNVGAGINNSTEQFSFLAQGGKTFTLSNGTMRFVASDSATAATPSTIGFLQGSGGVNFANNSGVTLGANVLAYEGSSQTMGGTNSPKLTLETGSVLLMASNVAAKSFVAHSLAGGGTVGSFQTDGTALVSVLTLDGSSGSTTFSGTIQNVYNPFTLTSAAVTVNINKTGGSTQIFSGTNTYTGTTTVSAGTLQLDAAQAVPQASATTVSGTGTIKLGSTAQTTLDSLTISGGGKFDLGQGKLLLNNGGGATALANFAALLTTGRAGGSGFFTSSAVNGSRDVGFKDTGTGIYARYTVLGDADLDGDADFNDFLALQASFGAAGSFANGDFNYDGQVDFNDFLVLQANFGQSVSGGDVAITSAQLAAMTAFAQSVPEPASLAVLGVGAAIGLKRRRK